MPCSGCWDAAPSRATLDGLVDRTGGGSLGAAKLLGQIDEPSLAAELRQLARDEEPRVRAGAVSSLGYSGTRDDLGLIVAALGDEDRGVRAAARASLGNVGGQEAADALAADLERDREDEEVDENVEALAWLGDRRGFEPARRRARAELAQAGSKGSPISMWAAMRLGGSQERDALLRVVIEIARAVEDPDGALQRHPHPERHLVERAREAFRLYSMALYREDPELREAAIIAFHEQDPEHAPMATYRRPPMPRQVLRPLRERVVPRAALIDADGPASRSDSPPAKFGGLPDWRTAPAWPLDAQGRPLMFFAQLPLLGDPARVAYVFVNGDADSLTFEPLGQGNAVVVQLGGRPHLPTEPLADGPGLFEQVPQPERFKPVARMRRLERYLHYAPGADPERWTFPLREEDVDYHDDPGDWNKVGGTPLYLQGEQKPPGGGWQFAFQFTSYRAGQELGDGAECYGFVRPDGTGAFLWQCH